MLHNLTGAALLQTNARFDALLPADVLLLGEQHDAPEHQVIHSQVIAVLAQRSLLGAVALEMADAGATTAALHPSSTELQAPSALKKKQSLALGGVRARHHDGSAGRGAGDGR